MLDCTAFGETNVGRKRAHNEDNLLVMADRNLFIVADGMGGHGHGEVASEIVVTTMREFCELVGRDDDATWPGRIERGRTESENMLNAGIKWANYSIWERGHADTKFKNMGTTVVGMHYDGEYCAIAHVGDSRCYRLRDGELTQITEDHSLLNDYKKMAVLTPEEEANFPHKNIIVRACGLKDDVVVDIQKEKPEDGDIYMFCSDGLNGEMENPEIRDIMVKHGTNVETMAKDLIRIACDNGGKDNVTAICVHMSASDD
mgnify:CR=1 FL=1